MHQTKNWEDNNMNDKRQSTDQNQMLKFSDKDFIYLFIYFILFFY